MEYIEKLPYSLKFIAHPLQGNRISVFARVVLKRNKSEFSTGIRAVAEDWDEAENRFRNDRAQSRYLNNRLSEWEGRIYDAFISIRNSGGRVSAAAIKDVATGRKSVGMPKLTSYISEYIDTMRKKNTFSPRTPKIYDAMLRHVQRYLRTKGISDLLLNEFRREHLVGLRDYLLTEYNTQCKGPISLTSCNKYLVKLKTVINDSLARNLISHNPYQGFKLEQDKVKADFLSPREIRLIADFDFENQPHFDRVRNAFIFACYTGLRYQDLMDLKRSRVFEQGGHTWIQVRQMKTKVLLTRPLLQPAIEIYKHYQKLYPDSEYVIPFSLTNQYFNRTLKQIAEVCGIYDKKITVHTARHSHACLLIENGVGLLETSYMMGHTSTRSTEIYAKVSQTRAMNVVAKVNENLGMSTW